MTKEDKKSDWIKWVAIILAFLFFLLWINSGSDYNEELKLKNSCEKNLELKEQELLNSVGNVAKECEKILLDYQAKYDCFERGTVECYNRGEVNCYEK